MDWDQADRLCVVGGALRLLNGFTVSRNKRVMFFTFDPLYAYASVTSASAKAYVAYGNTGSKIGRKNSGNPSICMFIHSLPRKSTELVELEAAA